MILVQWSCEVPQENFQKFVDFAENKLKPFYKSFGCLRYELFFPMIAEKQYFPYQITDNKNRYTEQLLFETYNDFENFYDAIEKEKAAQELVGMYIKEFHISKCKFKILELY